MSVCGFTKYKPKHITLDFFLFENVMQLSLFEDWILLLTIKSLEYKKAVTFINSILSILQRNAPLHDLVYWSVFPITR